MGLGYPPLLVGFFRTNYMSSSLAWLDAKLLAPLDLEDPKDMPKDPHDNITKAKEHYAQARGFQSYAEMLSKNGQETASRWPRVVFF